MTVKELYEFLEEEIKDGHSNHHVLLSGDAEGNSFSNISPNVEGGYMHRKALKTGRNLELELMEEKDFVEMKSNLNIEDYAKILIFYPS